MSVTRERLRELFDYRNDGSLVRRVSMRVGRAEAGRVIGTLHHSGYKVALVDKAQRRVHRLVWVWHFGDAPKYLDHINGDRADNRIENLRPASARENGANRRKQAQPTTSRFKGVSQDRGKWRALIYVNKRKIDLGRFPDEAAAAQAYDAAAVRYFGEYARCNGAN